jgi:hypothetical protein
MKILVFCKAVWYLTDERGKETKGAGDDMRYTTRKILLHRFQRNDEW